MTGPSKRELAAVVRIWLLGAGARRRVAPSVAPGAPGIAAGACPHCGAEPFEVRGRAARVAADDRAYEADAFAACCGVAVGTLRAEPETLFGVHEDLAMLEGRPRVY